MADPLTAADLDAIEQRVSAATEGPWEAGEDDWDGCYVRMPADGFGVAYIATHIQQGTDEGEADASFIARARADVPRLLAEVRRLQAADERVRALHRPVDIEPSDTICGECSYRLPSGRYLQPVVDYPCPTIAALNGDDHD